MKILTTLASTMALLLIASSALAKLPPPSDEAKARAEEAKAKAAQAGKVAAFKLCKVQDKVAADYRAHAKKSGSAVKAPVAMPPCANPGMVAPTAAKK